MAELTMSAVAFNDYLVNLVKTNASALGIPNLPTGQPAVFYGDQALVAVTPTVCIDPGEKRSTLNGAPRRTQIDLVSYILVYHNPVKAEDVLTREGDLFTEAIETKVHSAPQMGGLVIDSLVTQVEFGYAAKGKVLYRTSRLTVEGRSQAQLPSSF